MCVNCTDLNTHQKENHKNKPLKKTFQLMLDLIEEQNDDDEDNSDLI